MTKEIIVARYNEDVSWLRDSRFAWTVYNKGKMIPSPLVTPLLNHGREGHTYLHHIVARWNDLADVTLFCQGRNDDHLHGQSIEELLDMPDNIDVVVPRLVKLCEWDENGRLRHWGVWLDRYRSGEMRAAELSLTEWFRKYVNIDTAKLGGITYTPGAVFAVHRDVLQRRPLEFYRRLLESTPPHADPEEAYYLERAWMHIFAGDAPLRIKQLAH